MEDLGDRCGENRQTSKLPECRWYVPMSPGYGKVFRYSRYSWVLWKTMSANWQTFRFLQHNCLHSQFPGVHKFNFIVNQIKWPSRKEIDIRLLPKIKTTLSLARWGGTVRMPTFCFYLQIYLWQNVFGNITIPLCHVTNFRILHASVQFIDTFYLECRVGYPHL